MQITGKDITVSVGTHVNRDLISQIILALWPEGVIEELPDIHGLEEYFFFKTDKDRQSWDDHGLTEDNGDTMIHVLHDRAGPQVTFVVLETAGSGTQDVVDQVIKQIL